MLGDMSELKVRLQSDLTKAIRSRDEVALATLRMALTGIANEEVAGPVARELSDDDVAGVLQREAKRRREAAEAFDDAGRPDLADRERAELAVLERYLPAALTQEELAVLVADAVARAREEGVEGPRAMGAVMKVVQGQVAGRADGAVVAALVRAALGAG